MYVVCKVWVSKQPTRDIVPVGVRWSFNGREVSTLMPLPHCLRVGRIVVEALPMLTISTMLASEDILHGEGVVDLREKCQFKNTIFKNPVCFSNHPVMYRQYCAQTKEDTVLNYFIHRLLHSDPDRVTVFRI